MNTELRKKLNIILKKLFSSLQIGHFFDKTMKSMRKHRDMKLATTKKKEESLWCQSHIIMQQNLLAIEMKQNVNTHE